MDTCENSDKLHFRIEWRNFTYHHERPRDIIGNLTSVLRCNKTGYIRPRATINSLNGHFQSGKVSAILGPSGAGKTTFIDALFDPRHRQNATGDTRISWFEDVKLKRPIANDAKSQRRSLRVAHLGQHEQLSGCLTVFETLMFASKLKNHNHMNADSHESNVASYAAKLGLGHCLHTRCSKISGGERKRVLICQELLSDVDVLVLDEPTTGLDSASCERTIKTLKSFIRDKPICVIITIHQPDYDLFHMLDQVYVLAKGGVAIYEGKPRDVFARLDAAGLTVDRETIRNTNPAIILVQIASMDTTAEGSTLIRRLNAMQASKYEASMADRPQRSQGLVCERGKQEGYASFVSDSLVLANRTMLLMWRNPLDAATSLLTNIAAPIVLSIIFHGFSKETACPSLGRLDLMQFAMHESQDNTSSLYKHHLRMIRDVWGGFASAVVCLFIMVLNQTCCAASLWANEMSIPMREHRNGWYSVASFWAARFVSDVPMTLALSTLGLTLFLYMNESSWIDLNAVVALVFVLTVTTLTFRSIGFACGLLFVREPSTALAAAGGIIALCLGVSGVIIPFESMTRLGNTISEWSPMTHLFRIFTLIRYNGKQCACDQSQLVDRSARTIPSSLMETLDSWLVKQRSADLSQNSTVASLRTQTQQVRPRNVIEALQNGLATLINFGSPVKSCQDLKTYMVAQFQPHEHRDVNESLLSVVELLLWSLVITYIVCRVKMRQ